MNVVCLKGNLVRDPELKYTAAGTAICNITIAKSKRWKAADGEYQEKTGFYNCFCWGARGEALSNNFHKGKEIAIVGELDFNEWEQDDGQKRSAVKILINSWEFCGNKNDSQPRTQAGGGAQQEQPQVNDVAEEEIPF
jgi:single-strand DNA-binding protein